MNRTLSLLVALLCSLAMFCRGDEPADTTTAPPPSERETAISTSPSTPVGAEPSEDEMERERLSDRWRNLTSFSRADGRRPGTRADQQEDPAAAATVNLEPRMDRQETLDEISIETIERQPVLVPISGDVAGPSVLRTQVYLDHARFSPGVIDGRWGKNSAIAVYWFQYDAGLDPTGVVDAETFRRLASRVRIGSALTRHSITREDLAGPFETIPDDPYEKAELDCLCYESPLEKLSEDYHTTPAFLERLNPEVDFDSLTTGQSIVVPNVTRQSRRADVKRLIVSVEGNYLHAIGENDQILFHYPTTVGSQYDPSPTETLQVTAIAWDPTFFYQPKLFYEVPDDEPEAMMQPGPNSPVGVVWMQLSKQHYGIHGTSEPSTIGYASSHGCIRLTNWSARELGNAIEKGITVKFTDTRDAAPGGAVLGR
jgi:lipoprotein-anchoring transpeptidase ErfK/SrfK